MADMQYQIQSQTMGYGNVTESLMGTIPEHPTADEVMHSSAMRRTFNGLLFDPSSGPVTGDASQGGPPAGGGIPWMDVHNDTMFLNLNYADFTPIWGVRSPGEISLRLCLFLPTLIISLLGNIGILASVSRVPALRTPTNYFLCNMAASDLITSVCCGADALVGDMYQNYELGAIGCSLGAFTKGKKLSLKKLIEKSIST